jgi:dihydroorotate dehydrogenase
MGLTFRNKVGLAAGLDKNGDFINSLQNLGFGFIELGLLRQNHKMGIQNPEYFGFLKLRH